LTGRIRSCVRRDLRTSMSRRWNATIRKHWHEPDSRSEFSHSEAQRGVAWACSGRSLETCSPGRLASVVRTHVQRAGGVWCTVSLTQHDAAQHWDRHVHEVDNQCKVDGRCGYRVKTTTRGNATRSGRVTRTRAHALARVFVVERTSRPGSCGTGTPAFRRQLHRCLSSTTWGRRAMYGRVKVVKSPGGRRIAAGSSGRQYGSFSHGFKVRFFQCRAHVCAKCSRDLELTRAWQQAE